MYNTLLRFETSTLFVLVLFSLRIFFTWSIYSYKNPDSCHLFWPQRSLDNDPEQIKAPNSHLWHRSSILCLPTYWTDNANLNKIQFNIMLIIGKYWEHGGKTGLVENGDDPNVLNILGGCRKARQHCCN